jgi:hypothetical protein
MNEQCSVWFKVISENEQGVLVEGPYVLGQNAIDLNASIEERAFLREQLKRRASEFTSRSIFEWIMQEEAK